MQNPGARINWLVFFFNLHFLMVGLKGFFLHRPLRQSSDPGAGRFRIPRSPVGRDHTFPLAGEIRPVGLHEAGGLLGFVASGEDDEGSHHQVSAAFAAETFGNFPQCFQKIKRVAPLPPWPGFVQHLLLLFRQQAGQGRNHAGNRNMMRLLKNRPQHFLRILLLESPIDGGESIPSSKFTRYLLTDGFAEIIARKAVRKLQGLGRIRLHQIRQTPSQVESFIVGVSPQGGQGTRGIHFQQRGIILIKNS